MSTVPVKAYVEPDLARDIARIARAQNRSESAIIAEAIRARFAAMSEGVEGAVRDTQRRQLNRVEARIDKVVRDQALVKECLLVFVRIWLEHNPPIPEEMADSIAASAETRFQRFLDHLMRGLGPKGSVAGDALGGTPNNTGAHEP